MGDVANVAFEAEVPDILSAVKWGRDSVRIQFDVPVSPGYAHGGDNAAALKQLLDWRHLPLMVVVTPVKRDDGRDDPARSRKIHI